MSIQTTGTQAAIIAELRHNTGKSTIKERVLSFLAHFGPSSLELLSDVLGIPQQSLSGRIGELKEQNRIRFVGYRYTKFGRLGALWARVPQV